MACALVLAVSGCVTVDLPRISSHHHLTTIVTFYAAYDNDPPGSTTIAFPNPRHPRAGGTGTFDDPLTLAGATEVLEVGTLVYYAPLRRYFVMEDLCETCIARWNTTGEPQLDLWVGPAVDPGVVACEENLTPDRPVEVEIGPPSGRPVDTTPLYTEGHCITDP
jgi:hypothetical protein